MPDHVRTVLCPVDFSAASEEAARYAVALAQTLGATHLELAHVFHHPAVHLPDGTLAADASEELLRANARRQIEHLARRHSQHGLEIGHSLLLGLPTHTAILDRARDLDADLIVMSTTGRSGLSRFLMGSVAEKLVRLSPVPVCTVRAAEG